MSALQDRRRRLTAGLALVAALGFSVKVLFLATVGTDATWKDNVAGTAFLVGTVALLAAVGLAVWSSARGGSGARVALTIGAVVGTFLLQGAVDEVGVATLDRSLEDAFAFETSMVVSALGAFALWWWLRAPTDRQVAALG